MSNNLNIAFCFFGQVRFFEVIEVYRNWRNSDPNVNIDMFISTWTDFPYENEFEDFISINMIDLDDVNDIPWVNQYPRSIYSNTEYMAYHIIEVNKLRQNYELENKFKYDYVMFIRTDYLLNEKAFFVNIFKFTDNNLIMNGSVKECPCGLGWGNPNPDPKTGKVNCGLYVINHDSVWMGSSEIMDIFAKEIYNSFINYKPLKNTSQREIERHGGHSFFGTTIKRSKLPVRDIPKSNVNSGIPGMRGLLIRAHTDLPIFEKYLGIPSSELINKIMINRQSIENWRHNRISKWNLDTQN